MTWMQSLNGRAIDLICPRVEDVDFREIADQLAGITRYAGAAPLDVSVGLHTLIVSDALPERLKPYGLLHDAHEARIGDIISPAIMAIATMAAEVHREAAGNAEFVPPDTMPPVDLCVLSAVALLKERHDVVLFQAAGLSRPTPEMRAAVSHADRVALNTERRDFLNPSPQPWDRQIEAVPPLRRRYRWMPKPDVADELFSRFRRHLPALRLDRPDRPAEAAAMPGPRKRSFA